MNTIPERLLANLASEDSGPFLRLLNANEEEQTFTYQEVIQLSSVWANFYLQQNLTAGDRVVIIFQHSIDLYTAFLGALLAGLIPAMFAFPSPKFSEEEYFKTIIALLDNADAHLLITYPELKDKLQTHFAAHHYQYEICTPEDRSSQNTNLRFPVKPIDPVEIAFLQYSSGTTGLKKGVAISHEALLWQVDHYAKTIDLAHNDVIVSWLPLYHDMGLITCFFLPFIKKIKLVAMSPFDWVQKPVMLLRVISNYQGTLCWLPNFAYSFMARTIPETDLLGLNLSSLRGLVNCSEPIMEESHEAFTKRFSKWGFSPEALCASYAMAENTFAVTSGGFGQPLAKDFIDYREFIKSGQAVAVPPETPGGKILVSSGRVLPETQVEIVSETGLPLPNRHIGEIVLQSPCLLSEYYRNPEATQKAIREQKYYTGDLGYLAGDELFVTGRKKDMVIIGGQNIYPQDIEAIVNTVPGIIPGRNVALGVTDPALGTEKLVVLAETTAEDQTALAQIRREIYNKITGQTEVIASDIRLYRERHLLKSTSGKIARAANLERYLAEVAEAQTMGPTSQISVASPRNELQTTVRHCIERELSKNLAHQNLQLGDDMPIITAGLIDSFNLVELIIGLEQDCAVTIPPVVFSNPDKFDTIQSITRTIEELKNGYEIRNLLTTVPRSAADIPLKISEERSLRRTTGWWSWYYRWLFWRKGIQCGHGLQVHGRLMLRLVGNPRNISIGNNVTLMPLVDLKIRENGKIILHDGVVLDTMARLVAANNARLELGDEAQVAMGTVINAGADVIIGRRTAIAGFCTIIASEHKYNDKGPIMGQGYNHSPVYIGEDVWLAANVFVGRGTRIGNGAVIGTKSLVSGDIPAYAIVAGNPGRVIKFRN